MTEPAPQTLDSRLANLRQDLTDLRDGADPSLPRPEVDDATLRAFADSASTYGRLPITVLAACGVAPPAAEDLDDDALHRELWRLIWHLALVGLHLDHTDLLDDRALYTWLITEGLREPVALLPGDDEPRELVIDPLGDLRDPEIRRTLLSAFGDRFDADEREQLAEGLDGSIERRDPPSDRDRFLP
ncbi:MAG: hypothetical protein AAGE94_15470 [Acidobacteriota bacterium]